MNRPSAGLRRLFDISIVAIVSLAGLLTAAHGALAPRDASTGVAVIYAPWVEFDAAFLRSVEAGSRFVRPGGLPFVVVVVPDDPKFEQRVRDNGAWMLADPKVLAGCLEAVNWGAK